MAIILGGLELFQGQVVAARGGRALCWDGVGPLVVALVPESAVVKGDAPEATRRTAADLMKRHQQWRASMEATEVCAGAAVRVVRDGDAPAGITGTVFWRGRARGQDRVGLTVDAARVFTDAAAVELTVLPPPCRVEEVDLRTRRRVNAPVVVPGIDQDWGALVAEAMPCAAPTKAVTAMPAAVPVPQGMVADMTPPHSKLSAALAWAAGTMTVREG